MNIDDRIKPLIATFAEQIVALVREAVIESLGGDPAPPTFVGSIVKTPQGEMVVVTTGTQVAMAPLDEYKKWQAKSGVPWGTITVSPKAVSSLKKGRAVAGRKKGAKRSPAEIDKVQANVLVFIGKNPGCSVEQVKKGLGLGINDVTLPIAKLLAQKSISKKGLKRATRYWASKRVSKTASKKK